MSAWHSNTGYVLGSTAAAATQAATAESIPPDKPKTIDEMPDFLQ